MHSKNDADMQGLAELQFFFGVMMNSVENLSVASTAFIG
jgi:hypothetical protein